MLILPLIQEDIYPLWFTQNYLQSRRSAMSLRLLIYYAQLTGSTLDMLVGEMVPEYKATSLNHELQAAISRLNDGQKQKLIQVLDILID